MTTGRTDYAIREELTAMVRQAYIDERHNWNHSRGGKRGNYEPGPQWDKAWERMVTFFFKHQIDNWRAFIHVQFTSHANLSCCPTPQQCYGPKALERWHRRRPREAQIALDLKLQLDTLHDQIRHWKVLQPDWEGRRVDHLVLTDERNGLMPLMRYCVAYKAGYPQIARQFFCRARTQYMFAQDLYDRTWTSWITDELRQAARLFLLSHIQNGVTDANS